VWLPVEVEIDDGNASWHRFVLLKASFLQPHFCVGVMWETR
jgi:hypothetical protein